MSSVTVDMPRQASAALKNSEVSKEEAPLHGAVRKSKTPPKCSENAYYHFQSFAENASIDGIKFLGEKGRTILERIFWSVTLIVALILCLFLVVKTYQKWINSPVIVSFATKETSVFEIPFPAITICPETKVRKDVLNYSEVFLKLSNNQTVPEDQKIKFEYLSLICGTGSDLLDKNATTTSTDMFDFLVKEGILWNETLSSIQWKGNNIENKTTSFSPILTSEGICYTFNGLDRKDIFKTAVSYHEELFSVWQPSQWSPEVGYEKNGDVDAYPKRTTNAGAKGGITVMLILYKDNLDYACGEALQGFKVTLHNPTEIPRVRQNYFQLPLDQTVVAAIKPSMMTTSEDLRGYSSDDRKCYFSAEKKLKFFKNYNQQNCLIECLTNYTLRHCGCVNFQMPREEATPICGPKSISCVDEADVLYLSNDGNRKFENTKKPSAQADRCNCLPACDSLEFEVETSQANWNWKEAFKVLRQSKMGKEILYGVEDEQVHLMQLTVFFKDMQFLSSERNEWKGYTDFWSDVGGIIGLFTGFSFITMFEIFYYLSLRPTFNIKMFGRQFWSGAPELLEQRDVGRSR